MILDIKNAIEMMGDDEEIYRDVVETYLEDYLVVLSEAKLALEAKDPEALSRHAHSLKSSTRTVGGEDAGEIASKLEIVSKDLNFIESEKLLKNLTLELELLRVEIFKKGYSS